MQPKTIIQKEVVSLQHKLPEITRKHIKWVDKMNPFKYARLSKKEIICFECNHKWLQSEKTKDSKYCVCPKCKQRLEIVEHNRKIIDKFYMQILSVVGDFQVFSTFYIRTTKKCGQERQIIMYRVYDNWLRVTDQKEVVMALNRNAFGNYNDVAWITGNFEIRSNVNLACYNLDIDLIYKSVVHPIFYRNGFTGEFHGYNPYYLLANILECNKMETLLKCGQYELLNFRSKIEKRWPLIKICIRHNYIVMHPSSWFDLIKFLEELGKDIYNPKYICPENFDEAHKEAMNLVAIKRDKLRKEQAKKELLKAIEERKKQHYAKRNYKKLKGRLLDIVIKRKDLVIEPLKSIREFQQYSKFFDNCAYKSAYYAKEKSLVLVAKEKNVPIEMIEFGFENLRVEQAYSFGHNYSDRHDIIVKLVNQKASLFEKHFNEKSTHNVPRTGTDN